MSSRPTPPTRPQRPRPATEVAASAGAERPLRRGRVEAPTEASSSASGATPPASAGRRPVRGAGGATSGAAAPSPQNATSSAGLARGGRTVSAAPIAAPNKPKTMGTAIAALCELLQEENQALRDHRVEAVEQMVERKRLLTRAYLEQMHAIRKNPALVKGLPEEEREKLKQAALVLSPLMLENEQLLKARMEMVNRVMAAVVEAVREQRNNGSVIYGTTGAMNGTQAECRNLAVALNKEL